MQERRFFVYILTNASRTLYIGVTSNLERRVQEHKAKTLESFTSRYNITQLVYLAEFNDPRDAIEYEKKLELIETENPTWRDLSADW